MRHTNKVLAAEASKSKRRFLDAVARGVPEDRALAAHEATLAGLELARAWLVTG
jgi:hypothetical protein